LTLLLDENLSPKIATALKALGREVIHVNEILPRGTSDEEIFSKLAELGWYLLTQDIKIKRHKHQREAMIQAGIGALIFTGRADKSLEEMTIKILQHLDEIESLANNTRRPFVFGISDRGKIERLDKVG
jgi:predicted nuclease of predicted toxin-antitoxin system